MRPAGEIRRAVLQAAWDVAVQRAMQPVAGATQIDVVARLVPHQGMTRRSVKFTWQNLLRSGHLQPVGQLRLPDSPRALRAYVPAAPCASDAAPSAVDMMQVTRASAACNR
jgi:hypothetical protein